MKEGESFAEPKFKLPMKRLHQDAVPGVVQAEGCIPDLSELGEDDSVYAEHVDSRVSGQMAETMARLLKVAGQL